MKKKKIKFSMGLSVFVICFLISSSSINTLGTKAILEGTHNYPTTDSFERLPWKWNITELVSTESSDNSLNPSLAVDSADNIHIVWEDLSGFDSDILYKRYDPLSSSWTATEVISTESVTEGGSYYPSLAIDSEDNLHVVWEGVEIAGALADHQIFYKKWTALTQSWTTTELISTESTLGSFIPTIAIDYNNNLHVAWDDESNYDSSEIDRDVFYKRWNATLSSWTVTEVVSTVSTDTSFFPSLAVDSLGNVHITWTDWTDYNGAGNSQDVFYRCFIASSSSWTTTEVVSSESDGMASFPSIAVDIIDNIHISWQDNTDFGHGTDFDIAYKYFDSTLSMWSATELVSTESSDTSQYPSLVVDSIGNVHVAWNDFSDYLGAPGIENIFYKCRVSSSSSWSITEIVSTEYVTIAIFPSLAVDSLDNIHVSWSDINIYYKTLAPPPAPPDLAYIDPNPTQLSTVYLDWDSVRSASTYYVYRFNSYIWSVEDLSVHAIVTTSEYLDTMPSEGKYYYVVVAANFAGNSSKSNQQFVEVNFPDLDAPELSFILPNPTETDSVSLVWDEIDGAMEYYIYRFDTYIWSVEGLAPIATVGTNSYIDALPDEGFFFYVIVANDGVRNSTHSNCEYIQYKLPTLQEFTIVSSLLLGTFVVLFVVTRIRKKRPKPN